MSGAVVDVVSAPAAVADLIAIRHYIGHFDPAAARRMALRLSFVSRPPPKVSVNFLNAGAAVLTGMGRKTAYN